MCAVTGCERPVKAKSLCGLHYFRTWRHGSTDDPRPVARTCSVDGCSAKHQARGFCSPHYERFRRHGSPLGKAPRPKRGWTTQKGYKLIWAPEHPNRDKRGYVPEHVLVMTQRLGRALRPGETVHHRNGLRSDNRTENLELWFSPGQPSGQRVADLIRFANDVIGAYGDDPSNYA